MVKKELRARQTVRNILKRFPETRDSDRKLIIRYAQIYHKSNIRSFEAVMNELPPIKTLERARRYIQNTEGLYRATAETIAYRKRSQTEHKVYYANENKIINKALKMIGLK